MSRIRRHGIALCLGLMALGVALSACTRSSAGGHPHGPIAQGVAAPLGEPIPTATDEQLATFRRGLEVMTRRFGVTDGLGPAFNVVSCAACHERPVVGGSAASYRNFFLTGTKLPDGSFIPGTSAGKSGGVIRMYAYSGDLPARPAVEDGLNVIARRNAIPMFGVGLIAEIPESAILANADPDDRDGDGISGRPNYDRGFVGRFGRKAQTVSIEAFIRGPLFNHLGITTDPLDEEMRSHLPVDSTRAAADAAALITSFAQAAAPDGPTTDADGVADPELSTTDLFDLVSAAMLLAAPELEQPNEQGIRGAAIFDRIGCSACHTPRLEGPRGPLPVYSDLLLHDMGDGLADGIEQGDATGSEFRTQPLWGLAAVGPYLHDGRAGTIEDAILLHGGEAQRARDRAAGLSDAEMADLVEFLMSLGGRSQYSPGLIAPDDPLPAAGEFGGPVEGLGAEAMVLFEQGRAVFDRDHSFAEGLGATGFNGDSCRACHFDPVVGGSGPSDVNVMRHGRWDVATGFLDPDIGTILPKINGAPNTVNAPDLSANVFEHRQTPPLFGLGLIDRIPADVIVANEDPDDADGDGISGRASILDDGRLGRFGWKADVPTIAEFTRDAIGAELGMTLAFQNGLTFGRLHDEDGVADPEFPLADAELITFFVSNLAPPPRSGDPDDPLVLTGARIFEQVGCSSCHMPTLEGAEGPVALYSDLLLHDIMGPETRGIATGTASMSEFRTAPLWGLTHTAPYLHTGAAETIEEAILGHEAEGAASRDAYRALDPSELEALLAFLRSL